MYTLLAGHEEESSVDHATRAISAAASIVEAAQGVRTSKGNPVGIRIGIHSGPAVAGMIGCKGPRYCVVGESLEISSMLETTSYPACVQISDATYSQVRSSRVMEELEFHELKTPIMDAGTNVPATRYLLGVGNWEEALEEDEFAWENLVATERRSAADEATTAGAALSAKLQQETAKMRTAPRRSSQEVDAYNRNDVDDVMPSASPALSKRPSLFSCFASPSVSSS